MKALKTISLLALIYAPFRPEIFPLAPWSAVTGSIFGTIFALSAFTRPRVSWGMVGAFALAQASGVILEAKWNVPGALAAASVIFWVLIGAHDNAQKYPRITTQNCASNLKPPRNPSLN
jgi:hypothetical protein